jgi:biotin-(acetyl-CoA carboxylase) ligase
MTRVLTDTPSWAGDFLADCGAVVWHPLTPPLPHGLPPALLTPGAPLFEGHLEPPLSGIPTLILAQHTEGSQYDALRDWLRTQRPESPPPTLATLAGSGTGFHGSAGRRWLAHAGNLHLCVLLSPGVPISLPLALLTPLAVNAMADALEGLPGLAGRVQVKWVNDLLVDGRKVGGVLASTSTRGDRIEGLLFGIGVNVRATPEVERSLHVPAVGSLLERSHPDHQGAITPGRVLVDFLGALETSVGRLLTEAHEEVDGEHWILEAYRRRSAVLGREVRILEDRAGLEGSGPPSILAEGRVERIGEGLELYLSGSPNPVTRGRLEWREEGEE